MLNRREAIKLFGAGVVGAFALRLPSLPPIGGSTGVVEADLSWTGWVAAQDSLLLTQQGLWGVKYRQGKVWTEGYYCVTVTARADKLTEFQKPASRHALVTKTLNQVRDIMAEDTARPGYIRTASGYTYEFNKHNGECLGRRCNYDWLSVDEIQWVFRSEGPWAKYDRIFNETLNQFAKYTV